MPLEEPRVVWSSQGNITVIGVKRDDNGSYVCVAENSAGRDTRSGEITVQGTKRQFYYYSLQNVFWHVLLCVQVTNALLTRDSFA